jgi:hypothetical protein
MTKLRRFTAVYAARRGLRLGSKAENLKLANKVEIFYQTFTGTMVF